MGNYWLIDLTDGFDWLIILHGVTGQRYWWVIQYNYVSACVVSSNLNVVRRKKWKIGDQKYVCENRVSWGKLWKCGYKEEVKDRGSFCVRLEPVVGSCEYKLQVRVYIFSFFFSLFFFF
jgi:hypothetical protein